MFISQKVLCDQVGVELWAFVCILKFIHMDIYLKSVADVVMLELWVDG